MFQSVCITRDTFTDYRRQLDLGLIAESLVFYRHVYVVVSFVDLRQLIQACGANTLADLVEEKHLNLIYLPTHAAIVKPGDQPWYDTILASSPKQALDNAGPALLTEATGRPGRSRRLANRLMRHIEVVQHQTSLLEFVKSDFINQAYVSSAVEKILAFVAPEYPRDGAIQHYARTTLYRRH